MPAALSPLCLTLTGLKQVCPSKVLAMRYVIVYYLQNKFYRQIHICTWLTFMHMYLKLANSLISQTALLMNANMYIDVITYVAME